jgi:hypothetical protein
MEKMHVDFQNKIAEYDLILGKNKNDFASYFLRGKLKMKIKDFLGAEADFTFAIKKCPYNNKPDSYFYERAMAKIQLNDLVGATEDITKAIETPQGFGFNDDYYYQRAKVKIKLKKFNEAIEDLDNVISEKQFWIVDEGKIFLLRAKAKRKVFNFKGALADYKSAVDAYEYRIISSIDQILNKLENYKIKSGGTFWQENGNEKLIINLVQEIKDEMEKENYFFLNEKLEGHEFKEMMKDLDEKHEIDKYEKLPPLNKAKIQYYNGNYANAIDILKINNVSPEGNWKFFIELKLKLIDANLKVKSFSEEFWMYHSDEIKNNKYYLAYSEADFLRKHKISRNDLCLFWRQTFNKTDFLSKIKNEPKAIVNKIINDLTFILSPRVLYFLSECVTDFDAEILSAFEINLVKLALFSSWTADIEQENEEYYAENSGGDISNRDAFDTDEQYNDWLNQ